ncbi:DUF11 domain-containing protein [Wenzhouxiangella sp. XN79A]|uniref:DUF11 domain-containing protein n=1 Tax=Wenzhouxiangella sp. XN79A TaxID=2724193 RepID=UPI00144A59D3|nr:DUF11 domain-containing protein [Wenzhouxiangella sp. XN79A]NKI34363.1 DUF11 domain-containing protein [Wenzhouxiangella sp. XN79A]
MTGNPESFARTILLGATVLASFQALWIEPAEAQDVDLVVNIVSDQPAYMSLDSESFTVTISNNGPDTATGVELIVEHPVADAPFEASATCQPIPGPDPNGPAVCPPGSGTAPSPAFVRSGATFSVTIPSVPSQSQVAIEFENVPRCPTGEAGEGTCFGVPEGNFTISADVTSVESELIGETNSATTNIFLYPPDVQYRIEIVEAPATASPGDIVEYEFEVYSFGLHPSDRLQLTANIEGLAGTMIPLDPTNNPYGSQGSTLPGTELQSIDCVSASLGGFPPANVFPPSPAPWQTCPSTGLIPIPTPTSFVNSTPVTGFPSADFLDNLPGTLDGPPGGGVLRFRASVEVGEPVCVDQPDSGYRELVFEVNVNGLQGTDVVPPGVADNTASVTTEVPGNCEVADIEFTTSGTPSSFTLDGNGEGDWTHVTTVTNLSTGPGAGTATDIPVEFRHYSLAFTETQGPLTCTSIPAGLCPTPAEISAGIIASTATSFQFATSIDSLPPGASVTFSQPLSESRLTCWGDDEALISLSGQAGPSPAVFDPVYSTTTPPQPPDFTPGSNAYFGNNGMQTIVSVDGLQICPGGGSQVNIELEKTGPFASAADAAAGTPLIGQSAGTAIADGTQVFYKLVATNTNSANPVLLGDIDDINFLVGGLTPATSGFINTGTALADWGITCTAAPATETCHELATTFTSSGYNRTLSLEYDPALHGGQEQVALAPLATLTYIVPFTMPTHYDQCHAPQQVSNRVTADYSNALGDVVTTPQSVVEQYIGMPPCTPGTLDVEKQILPPATGTSIPLSGQIGYAITLTNTSPTETLDIPHFVDTTFAFGVDVDIVNIDCTPVSGGAQCPTTPVIPGVQTPASGPTSALSNPYDIDHEWGSPGNNTFPPNSSLTFEITVELSNPTRSFGCIVNTATFSGENDANGWVFDDDTAVSCPPPAPELSLQKQVTPQIAAPGSLVTYTVTVTNIGAVDADGSVWSDALPPELAAANPSGYSNVGCTDISASPFIPNPQGTAICPTVTSTSAGLTATIDTFGPNTALQFSYQAVMPDVSSVPVSVDNLATITPPSASGLSFGAGTAQSEQNVQVTGPAAGGPEPPLSVPAAGRWALFVLAFLLAMLAMSRMRREV